MAGTVRMKIEQYLDGGGTNGKQRAAHEYFTNLFNFLEAHPGTTRIALGYGSGGTGTDYPDGADPWGNTPFAVYRFDSNAGRTWDWYLFISAGNAVGDFTAITAWRPNGNGATASYGHVVASAAVGIGGDGNPWGGTTNNDGTDTIPSPTTDLWINPSAGTNVKVIPASNSTNGSGSVEDKNEVFDLFQESGDPYFHRAHFIADDDGIVIVTRERDLGAHKVSFFGMIDVPNPALSHPNPLVGFTTITYPSNSSQTFIDYDGGITHADDAEAGWESTVARIDYPVYSEDEDHHPHQQSGKRGTMAIDIVSDTAGHMGPMGSLTTLLRGIPNCAPMVTNGDRTKRVFGEDGYEPYVNLVVPWDGTTEPDLNRTRAGIDYVEGA